MLPKHLTKHLQKFLILISLLFTATAFAGSGHEHGSDGGHSHGAVSKNTVIKSAMTKVNKLIKAGKIDQSWSTVKKTNIKKKSYSHGPEWVVSLFNVKENNKTKQTLYIFYSLDGHYIAANFSGK